jgi:hypothetical protein
MKLDWRLLLAGACVAVGLAGCAGDGSTVEVGSIQVFVEPEPTIPQGIDPGTGRENIMDGWKVTYDRFLVTVGNVRAARSDASETLGSSSVFVLDLKHAPAGGYVIATLSDVSAVRWDRFGFDLPNATPGARVLAPTSQADADFMVAHGYSIYLEGAIAKADGRSCPSGSVDPSECVDAKRVTFRWGLEAGTSFDDCASGDGMMGFAVPSGGAVQVKPTIHGDHWFFSNVTSGAELTQRYAQYIADSDLDHDGEATLDELRQVKAADVFPSPRYNLAGALGGPIGTAADYVLAQARSIGDFQGDGECPTRMILP